MVQVSGGALARTSSVAPSIKINPNFRGNRVDTIFGAGLAALLFFLLAVLVSFAGGLAPLRFRGALKEISRASSSHPAEMTISTNLIRDSFELASARCENLTPLVYRRLFREHPEAEQMFRSEGSDPVKGSMLALTIDAILDFAHRTGSFRMATASHSPSRLARARASG